MPKTVVKGRSPQGQHRTLKPKSQNEDDAFWFLVALTPPFLSSPRPPPHPPTATRAEAGCSAPREGTWGKFRCQYPEGDGEVMLDVLGSGVQRYSLRAASTTTPTSTSTPSSIPTRRGGTWAALGP